MNSNKIKGTALLLLATFFWGSSFIATKSVGDVFPLCALVALRTFLGSSSVALVNIKTLKNAKKQTVIRGLLLGLLYGWGMVIQSYGVKLTNPGRGAFLSCCYCIMMPFLELLFLKHKLKIQSLAGSLLGFIGVGLVAVTESFTIEFGDLVSLASSVIFGFEIILFSSFVEEKKDDATVLITCLLASSFVYLTIISLFTGAFKTHVDLKAILAIIYLGLFCTGFPLLFQGLAQKSLSATIVAILLSFQSIFATVLSAIIYKESFSVKCLIGFAMIIFAAIISQVEFKNRSIEKNREQI